MSRWAKGFEVSRKVSKSVKRLQSDALGPFIWPKYGFFRRFSEANSHDAGDFWLCAFQAALISNRLKIICKVLRDIYTPRGRGGWGASLRGSGVSKDPLLLTASIVLRERRMFCNRLAPPTIGGKANLRHSGIRPDEMGVFHS
jgi:hypothetical protein